MGESENIQNDEYEYLIDLTFRDRIFCLNHRHTSIVIRKGLGNDVNLKQHCVFLDFSGSKIGDEGVCLISKILRLDRSIRAVSLRDCSISDIGVEALSEVVTAFTLTNYELAKRRQLKMKFILEDEAIEDVVSSRLNQENGPIINRQLALSNKNQCSKKNPQKQSKTSARIKERGNCSKKDAKEAYLSELEDKKQREKQLELRHPLLAEIKGEGAFGLQILGNYMLSMVNLSQNNITDFGIRILAKAIEIQTSQLMVSGLQYGFGLTDILIKNNKFRETDEAYMLFIKELERKRNCIENIS
ncbi:hypothetical protein ACTXT7_008051 [Hymenolepis weldensis]